MGLLKGHTFHVILCTLCAFIRCLLGISTVFSTAFSTTVFSTTVFSVLSVLSLFGCVQAMSITQVIEACSNEDDACLRADNSHGHWGSCNADANVAVNDDCNYFSPMYYRDLKKGEQPPTPPSTANTT